MKKLTTLAIIAIMICGAIFIAATPLNFDNAVEAVSINATSTSTTTAPPNIDTSDLELWDGTANIGWFITGTAQGRGTAENPFSISNARELAGLGAITALGNGNSIRVDSNTASSTFGNVGTQFDGTIATTNFYRQYVRLENHIYLNTWNGNLEMEFDDFSNINDTDNESINWNPINNFRGAFNGHDRAILGIAIRNGSGDVGLFGQTHRIIISNIVIANGRIDSNSGAGGIVGWDSSVGESSFIINSTNFATISAAVSTGGIIGRIEGGLEIFRSANHGLVFSTDTATNGGTGGIVGRNNSGLIKESANTGDVTGFRNVGGIVGNNNVSNRTGRIIGNKNTGAIMGTQNVGGIAGRNYSATFSATNVAEVRYSLNVGVVTGDVNVGGVIGYDQRGTVRHNYFDDTIATGISAIGEGNCPTTFGRTTVQLQGIDNNFGSGLSAQFRNAKSDYGLLIWQAVNNQYPQFALYELNAQSHIPSVSLEDNILTVNTQNTVSNIIIRFYDTIIGNVRYFYHDITNSFSIDLTIQQWLYNFDGYFYYGLHEISVRAITPWLGQNLYSDWSQVVIHTALPSTPTNINLNVTQFRWSFPWHINRFRFMFYDQLNSVVSYRNFDGFGGSSNEINLHSQMAYWNFISSTYQVSIASIAIRNGQEILSNWSEPVVFRFDGNYNGNHYAPPWLTLSAPTNLRISRSTLSWNAVPNATGYHIYRLNINGVYQRLTTQAITSTSFNLRDLNLGAGNHEIQVRAICINYNFSYSPLSSTLTFNPNDDDFLIRIFAGVFGIVLLLVGLILLIVGLKKVRSKVAHLYCVQRTSEQQKLFWNSNAAKRYASRIKALKRNLKIQYIIFGILALAGAIVGFFSYMIGFILSGSAIVLVLVLWAILAKRTIRSHGTATSDWNNEDCIKCGGNNPVVKSEFNKTETSTEEFVFETDYELQAHREHLGGQSRIVGEIKPHYVEGSAGSEGKWKKVAMLEIDYHYYDVTRKCDVCNEVSEFLEQSDTPPQVAPIINNTTHNTTNIHVENMTAQKIADTVNVEIKAPPPLPFVYCQFCGGRNKGEVTKCEHCGGTIFKIEPQHCPPPPPVFCQKCGGKNNADVEECEHCNGKIYK